MKKPFGLIFVVICVILAAAFSQGFLNKACGKGMAGQGKSGGMMLDLGLTGAQKDLINTREADLEKNLLPLKDIIRDLKYQLDSELLLDSPDKAKINDLTDRISDKMTEVQKRKLGFMLWMREQLTPEQKQRLKTLMESREQNKQ